MYRIPNISCSFLGFWCSDVPPDNRLVAGLYPKTEASFGEFFVASWIESVEPGRSMGHVFLNFVGLLEETHTEDFFAKIPFVDRFVQARLVEMLKRAERKSLGKEFEADGVVADLSFEAFEGIGDDLCMVEGERGGFVDVKPGGIAGIGGRMNAVVGHADEGIVGDTDHPFSWIPIEVAVGEELFEIHIFDTRLLA